MDDISKQIDLPSSSLLITNYPSSGYNFENLLIINLIDQWIISMHAQIQIIESNLT